MSIGVARTQHADVNVPMLAIELGRRGETTPRFDALVPVRSDKVTARTTCDLYGLQLAYGRGQIGRAETLRCLRRTIRSALRADNHSTWLLSDPLRTLGILARLATNQVRGDRTL